MDKSLLINKDLIQENEIQRLLLDLKIGIYMFTVDGKSLNANSIFLQIFGYPQEELTSLTLDDLFEPIYREGLLNGFSSKHEQKIELIGKKKDQSHVILQLLFREIKDSTNIVVFFKDITDQKKDEIQLKRTYKELQDFKYALDQSATVSITDKDGNITYVNDKFCEISQYSRNEMIGQNHRIINSGYHPKELFEKMWSTITKGKVWRGEVRNKAKDGTIWWGGATIVPFLDDNGEPYQYVAIRSDITDRKSLEEKIYQMAYFDDLTLLPNKRRFDSQLVHEFVQAKKTNGKFALMLIDLQGFKYITDTLGTEIGDQLLKEVSQRLVKYVQRIGQLYRLDGDEFIAILPDIFNQKIYRISNDLFELVQKPFTIKEYNLFLGSNIGVSIYPYSANSVYSLIRNTYSALYKSKEKGTNQFEIFSPNMDISTFKTFVLKNDLRKAVMKNEFFIVYQPKVETKTNRIIGVEALVRWEHPKWGVVTPLEFITLAEESGLIGLVGEIVLFNACSQNKTWQEAGLTPIVISVNFSVLQFLQTDIIETIERILKETGLDPKWLEIEITETAFVKDESTLLVKIDQLKEMGIKIAIDDFGTGYSSFSYLQKFNSNTLKIDKSFIDGIPDKASSKEIVSSIIHLAQKLKIRTVAEGVETIEQLEFLNQIHCEEIQGYLFSKPVPAQEFERLLSKLICSPKRLEERTDIQYKNRRNYFRINLTYPLIAAMSISEFGGKKVELGSTETLILDIGPGGIRVETSIKLPPRSDLILRFTTTILGKEIDLNGTIAWKREINDDLMMYGVNLVIHEKARSELTALLNRFQARLRHNPLLTDCSFINESRKEYLTQ